MPRLRVVLLIWQITGLLGLMSLSSSVAAQFRGHTRGVVAIYGVEASAALAGQLETQFRIFGWDALFASSESPATEPLIAELYFAYGYNSAQPSILTLKGPRPMGADGSGVVWATLASDRFEPGLHPRVIALRAAELVRASLGIDEPQAQQARRADEPVSSDPSFSLGLGAGVVSGETLGFGLAVVPRAQVFVHRGWNVEALATLPLTVQRVDGDAGHADVRVFVLGLGVGHTFEVVHNALLIDLSLGGGAALLPMEGKPRENYTANSETVTTAVTYAGAKVSYPLFDGLRVASGVMVGLAVPAVRLRFDGRTVGSWGQPLLALSAGLQTP